METHWFMHPHRDLHTTWASIGVRQCTSIFTQVLAWIVALFLLISRPVICWAAPSGISISPAFSQVQLAQGEEKQTVQIEITNQTENDSTFVLQAVDISQMDSDGNVQLVEKPVEGNALAFAQYISITPERLTVRAKATEKILVEIRNDQSLSPGGHYAAILLKGTDIRASTGQTVIPALTSFVLVNKTGGEIYSLSLQHIQGFSASVLFSLPEVITLRFQNAGNTHTAPYGSVIIRDIFGRSVREALINEGSKIVLPESSRDYVVSLKHQSFAFPIMFYTMTVDGHANPGDIRFQQSSSFIYLSPLTLVGVGAVIVVGFFVGKKRRIR